ncbi:hypothetical protein [Arenibacter latericius]|uniref:hypothetical protein n=1 Tax=Arenibacter latericius TaxID=86104 RepID=UPI00041C3436|nr:hypothetical protein [Arenibacter latericius]MDX1365217.1 hypothetical protein [Arenibacter latericius]
MRKNIIGLFLITVTFNAQAQTNKKTFVDDQSYKDISQFSTNDFINMDYNFLGFLPTLKDYKNPVTQFKKGNKNTFRYIDSLDIKKLTKDSFSIKMYTQNYAYSSQNSYIVGKNKSDTMMILDGKINQRLKSEISEAETFRKSDYELNITEKFIDKENPIRRIIFKKLSTK